MNIVRLWRLYRKANRVIDMMQEGTVKSLWKSKTFWVNLLTGLFELFQYVQQVELIPHEVVGLVLATINIPLRLLTTQAVSVSGAEKPTSGGDA